MLQAGDVLFFWNLPYPVASCLIAFASGGMHCEHCAIVLEDQGELMVYDAYPPASRKIPLREFEEQLRLWRLQKSPRRPVLQVEIWRSKIDAAQLEALHSEAERLLGIRYGMTGNFLFGTRKIHCSEFLGRVLEGGEVVSLGRRKHRLTPFKVRQALPNNWYQALGEKL